MFLLIAHYRINKSKAKREWSPRLPLYKSNIIHRAAYKDDINIDMQCVTQHLAGALVLALFLSGCTLIESDEEAGNLELIGAWRLVYMDGGWGGGRHYPEPGEVIQLHLTDRSYYLLKKNDKSVAFGRYRVQHAESEALIRFEAKPADFCNPYSYRITGDTLSLRTKQCMDSFDPTYVRVR